MEAFTYHLMWCAAATYSQKLAPEGNTLLSYFNRYSIIDFFNYFLFNIILSFFIHRWVMSRLSIRIASLINSFSFSTYYIQSNVFGSKCFQWIDYILLVLIWTDIKLANWLSKFIEYNWGKSSKFGVSLK